MYPILSGQEEQWLLFELGSKNVTTLMGQTLVPATVVQTCMSSLNAQAVVLIGRAKRSAVPAELRNMLGRNSCALCTKNTSCPGQTLSKAAWSLSRCDNKTLVNVVRYAYYDRSW